MEWEETAYLIKKIGSGIPPQNMKTFSATPGNGEVMLKFEMPKNTIIENQLICTVKGVRIIRKEGSAPNNQNDGKVIIDLPYDVIKFSHNDNDVVNDKTYYYGFFPYSDHNVYNINPENILSATPKEGEIIPPEPEQPEIKPLSITWTWRASDGYAPVLTISTSGGMNISKSGDSIEFYYPQYGGERYIKIHGRTSYQGTPNNKIVGYMSVNDNIKGTLYGNDWDHPWTDPLTPFGNERNYYYTWNP